MVPGLRLHFEQSLGRPQSASVEKHLLSPVFSEFPSAGSWAFDYISLHVIHIINTSHNTTVSIIIFPTLHVDSDSSQPTMSSSYPLFSTLLRFLSFCSNLMISYCFELPLGTCKFSTTHISYSSHGSEAWLSVALEFVVGRASWPPKLRALLPFCRVVVGRNCSVTPFPDPFASSWGYETNCGQWTKRGLYWFGLGVVTVSSMPSSLALPLHWQVWTPEVGNSRALGWKGLDSWVITWRITF